MVYNVQIGHFNGSISFGYEAVRFFGISGSSVCLRYQLVRYYNVSKTSVSFRYQLWHLFNVLNWSVSLKYQLVRRYDVSNRWIFSTYQWYVTKASQMGPSHLRTSFDVVMTSQHGPRRHETYMKPIWNLIKKLLQRRIPGEMFGKLTILLQLSQLFKTAVKQYETS